MQGLARYYGFVVNADGLWKQSAAYEVGDRAKRAKVDVSGDSTLQAFAEVVAEKLNQLLDQLWNDFYDSGEDMDMNEADYSRLESIGNADTIAVKEMMKLRRFIHYASGVQGHIRKRLRMWQVNGLRCRRVTGKCELNVMHFDTSSNKKAMYEVIVEEILTQMKYRSKNGGVQEWQEARKQLRLEAHLEELEALRKDVISHDDDDMNTWDVGLHEDVLELRKFEDKPSQCAPYNCRLCYKGYCDTTSFKNHLDAEHHGEFLYRSRLHFLLTQEYTCFLVEWVVARGMHVTHKYP